MASDSRIPTNADSQGSEVEPPDHREEQGHDHQSDGRLDQLVDQQFVTRERRREQEIDLGRAEVDRLLASGSEDDQQGENQQRQGGERFQSCRRSARPDAVRS